MRQLADIATGPQRHDAIEFQGKVYEVVDTQDGKVIYRVSQARPKRARWMTLHGWATLCQSNGVETSDYSSGG
jgi:hypothetical protein